MDIGEGGDRMGGDRMEWDLLEGRTDVCWRGDVTPLW